MLAALSLSSKSQVYIHLLCSLWECPYNDVMALEAFDWLVFTWHALNTQPFYLTTQENEQKSSELSGGELLACSHLVHPSKQTICYKHHSTVLLLRNQKLLCSQMNRSLCEIDSRTESENSEYAEADRSLCGICTTKTIHVHSGSLQASFTKDL